MFVKDLTIIKGQEQAPHRIHMSVDGFSDCGRLHPVVSAETREEMEECLVTLIYEAAHQAGVSPAVLVKRLADIVRREELSGLKQIVRDLCGRAQA